MIRPQVEQLESRRLLSGFFRPDAPPPAPAGSDQPSLAGEMNDGSVSTGPGQNPGAAGPGDYGGTWIDRRASRFDGGGSAPAQGNLWAQRDAPPPGNIPAAAGNGAGLTEVISFTETPYGLAIAVSFVGGTPPPAGSSSAGTAPPAGATGGAGAALDHLDPSAGPRGNSVYANNGDALTHLAPVSTAPVSTAPASSPVTADTTSATVTVRPVIVTLRVATPAAAPADVTPDVPRAGGITVPAAPAGSAVVSAPVTPALRAETPARAEAARAEAAAGPTLSLLVGPPAGQVVRDTAEASPPAPGLPPVVPVTAPRGGDVRDAGPAFSALPLTGMMPHPSQAVVAALEHGIRDFLEQVERQGQVWARRADVPGLSPWLLAGAAAAAASEIARRQLRRHAAPVEVIRLGPPSRPSGGLS